MILSIKMKDIRWKRSMRATKKMKKTSKMNLVRSSGKAASTLRTSSKASKSPKMTPKRTTSLTLKKIVVGELGSSLLIINNQMKPNAAPIQ